MPALSYDVDMKRRPSLLKLMSRTPLEWPMYVRMHFWVPGTSQILTLPSSPADSSRWPVSGKKRIALTPWFGAVED